MAAILEAHAAGQLDFGENRVQELTEKHPQLPEARWHMIGRLQRNKVKYIAPYIHLIHSVDSQRLLKEIDKEAKKAGRRINCLLQIDISHEEQKAGLDETEASAILEQHTSYPNINFKGLMGMASFTDDTALIQSQFEQLSEAFKRFQTFGLADFTELSMGMSGDYPIAIAEGATLVRIGSAIFGHR
ncbi:UNVERIFIED_CONTAM: hypothetical protein GTU68_031005 [Idotea baltica]|nr:hypothetical protein [Idotea baltica]